MTVTRLVLCAAFLLSAMPASAQVKLEFVDGRVNLVAQNAPLRTILAEWARLGGAQIVNGDKVTGAPVTLELHGEPERQALDILLRGVAGYMIAAREAPRAGASAFDRIMIMPTSNAPRQTAPAASNVFAPPPPPPIVSFEDDVIEAADDGVPGPEDAIRLAQEQLRRRVEEARQNFERAQQANQPGPGRVVGQPVIPGMTGGGISVNPGAPPSFFPTPSQPATGSRPPTSPTPFSPFTPTPTGSARPGEITPGPQPLPPGDRDDDDDER